MSQRDYLSVMAEGRAGRPQFWSFYALMALPTAGLVLAALSARTTEGTPLLIIAAMAWITLLFLPATMLMARRFHDLGWRGRNALGQFAAVIAALTAILLYPVVYPRPSVAACVNFGMILRLDDPSGTSERRSDSEECTAARSAAEAYDIRFRTIQIALATVAGAAHLATLAAMARPSQPGPNSYGPNPQEVTK